MESKENRPLPLFETKKARGGKVYRLFAASIFVGIVCIWYYRWSHIPSSGQNGRIGWIGMLGAELWFGLYWILSQSLRWNLIFRYTFKDRLTLRYGNDLPGVDIFVCTADPTIEPPIMVVNTVLSVMAYDYPSEKLSIYLSDDAGSNITFYALLEASIFAKHWLPYCRRYKVEPTSPEAYFRSGAESCCDASHAKELASIKNLYEDMKNRIEIATSIGRIPEDMRQQHSGFSHWNSFSSRHDHDTILKIAIDGKDLSARDMEGYTLPTLVYLAREKRPNHPHNFKAGAMNALLRVSSKISNAQIILNVDCDMYSNNSQSIKDALCFLLDEEKGIEFAFVQFPQNFENISENDIYGASLLIISEVDFHGLDGHGGPLYVGSGCFHKREVLCGKKFDKENKIVLWSANDRNVESLSELEEGAKGLASCTYENNTQWGKEVGLKYGCPVEDVITGLSIQSNGWKSVYFNPKRKAFLGVIPTSLGQTLVQHKRWSEGDLQILLSKYSPAWYGLGRINPGLTMGYCTYCLWAPSSIATLYYCIIPSLYLLKGTPMFPQTSSPWFVAFAYVIIAKYTHSFGEFLFSGGTVKAWWNEQRIWLYKRTSSYLFGFVDTILKLMGFSESGFIISPKVSDEDVSQRYQQEMMEFGDSSPMFIIISSTALVNLFCFMWMAKKVASDLGMVRVYVGMPLQIVLCGALVGINLPLFNALFIRKDKGKMPSSVAFKSVFWALFACVCFAVSF